MNKAKALEVNFDGLVGPTHNYAGLGSGNLASLNHKHRASNPRAAALQGLEKMNLLRQLGVPQGVLPPQLRPDLPLLRRLGFTGDDARVIYRAAQEAPQLLAAAYSSSAMWAANAATVCPSADAADGKVHFTPANLGSNLHRAIEPTQTAAILQRIFPDPNHFVHHPNIPYANSMGDEGAANQTRLCNHFGQPGLQLFVYGAESGQSKTSRFNARQSCTASESVARQHRLNPQTTLFIEQNPKAIDAGVFHNDVISVGHRDLLFCHEMAYTNQKEVVTRLREAASFDLKILEVSDKEIDISTAVKTYLFNSQIVTSKNGGKVLIAPSECESDRSVHDLLRWYVEHDYFDRVIYVDLKQSMQNGGGPACLRLRIELTEQELDTVHPGVLLNDQLSDALSSLINNHYRDNLKPDDLADPRFLKEAIETHVAINDLLGLSKLSIKGL